MQKETERVDSRTRFVWKHGAETWHLTLTTPYSPVWEMEVRPDHPELPLGRHTFTLVRPEDGEPYYKEV